jgi:hypothetical protein
LREKNSEKTIEIDEKYFEFKFRGFFEAFMFLHHPAPPLTPLLTRF